jgi:hypothetical protein
VLQRCWIVAARRVLRAALVRTVTAGQAIADASDAHRARHHKRVNWLSPVKNNFVVDLYFQVLSAGGRLTVRDP